MYNVGVARGKGVQRRSKAFVAYATKHKIRYKNQGIGNARTTNKQGGWWIVQREKVGGGFIRKLATPYMI